MIDLRGHVGAIAYETSLAKPLLQKILPHSGEAWRTYSKSRNLVLELGIILTVLMAWQSILNAILRSRQPWKVA